MKVAEELWLVVWRDAWFDFDDPEEHRDDYLVSTVGYIVRENDRFLSIAQEVLPDGDGYRAVTHIPVHIIKERHLLMVVKNVLSTPLAPAR